MIDNWNNLVEAMSAEWVVNEVTDGLLRSLGDSDLAIVVWACLRSQSLEWIHAPVPMLGGAKPVDMVNSEEDKDKLRWILLSGPWR